MHEPDTDIFHIIKRDKTVNVKKGKSNTLSFHTNVAVTCIFISIVHSVVQSSCHSHKMTKLCVYRRGRSTKR